MLEGRHYQIAYVTNDAVAAAERFRARADVRQETLTESKIEVSTPAGPATLHNKLALIWVGDVQYEFVEPVGYSPLYSPTIAQDGSLRLHHVAMRIDDWDDFRGRVARQPFPLVMEGAYGELKFLYLDARPLLGHYLEYLYAPEAVWTGMGGR